MLTAIVTVITIINAQQIEREINARLPPTPCYCSLELKRKPKSMRTGCMADENMALLYERPCPQARTSLS